MSISINELKAIIENNNRLDYEKKKAAIKAPKVSAIAPAVPVVPVAPIVEQIDDPFNRDAELLENVAESVDDGILDIVLSDSQQAVLDEIIKWFKDKKGDMVYEFAGIAGAGKTTVVRLILRALKLSAGEVAMAALTGTASLVLTEKTPGYEAMTIARTFYAYETNAQGKQVRIPTVKNIKHAKLVLIDEASMVGQRTAEEILKLAKKANVKVLIVGDPEQLPPVGEKEYFFKEPNAFLDEPMRQALENSIVEVSFAIRNAKQAGHAFQWPKEDGRIGNNVFIKDVDTANVSQFAKVLENGGAIICGKNKTRTTWNTALRAHLGFTKPTLMEGEKVLIKENLAEDHEGMAVTNGMIGIVSQVRILGEEAGEYRGLIEFTFKPDKFKGTRRMRVHPEVLFEKTKIDNLPIRDEDGERLSVGSELFFGYVITCHASQGSQWDNVYVFDESSVFNRDKLGYIAQNRWLYTAVTRAAKNVVVYRAVGGRQWR